MNPVLYAIVSLLASSCLGAGIFLFLGEAAKMNGWTDVRVRYLNPVGHQVSFTADGYTLREKRGGELAVSFSSRAPGDLAARMEHRDEALRGQGYTPDCDWRVLFGVDTPLLEG